ncbi:M48 family metallopeptidase [Sedimentitalea sp. XS_ASV28]|uniref:M48 metallopeptidase family protein n=1 Tax=Sedimentitalea sp. XS_ASV28 TaxID=3241296 RepID=UPI0035186AC8
MGQLQCRKTDHLVELFAREKPEAMIVYVILHELTHLISPRHDQRFTAVLDREVPRWRNMRKWLNTLPLEAWID